MTCEHHIPLIIIKQLWGGPFEDQNTHSLYTTITINIHIENTNVICLFFEFLVSFILG